MNYKLLLLPTIVLLALGIVLIATTTTEPVVASDINNSTALLVITTYQPWCTALELNHLNITRLTDVYPYYRSGEFGYDPADLRNGINITAVIWEQDFNMIVLDLLEQPEVTNVAMHSPVMQNATTSTVLEQAVNHNATWRGDSISRCGDAVDQNTLMRILDLVGLEGAEPGTGPTGLPPSNRTEPEPAGIAGASGAESEPLTLDPRPPGLPDPESQIYYYGDLMAVSITTYGNAATDIWRYLKDNGALVFHVRYDEKTDSIGAYVPPSILWPLSTMDDIRKINPIRPLDTEHYGSINTEGLWDTVHPYVEQWHDLGYNGTGVRVGIIDGSFNLPITTGDNLPPQADITCHGGCASAVYRTQGGAHGTAVAEIVMDMAPGVELFLTNSTRHLDDLHAAVNWLINDHDVHIISMSARYPFEGPGNGTSPVPNSALSAVDNAIGNGTMWVNSAGNYGLAGWLANGTDVQTIRERTNPGSRADPEFITWIDFDIEPGASNISNTNYVLSSSGPNYPFRTTLDLRWSGGGELHLGLYNAVTDRLYHNATRPYGEGEPVKSLGPFSAGSSTGFRIWVNGSTVPDWIQLVSYTFDTRLEFNNTRGGVNTPSDSHNAGMLAAGAVAANVTATPRAAGYTFLDKVDYSSRGDHPGPQGTRSKPDIYGASHVTTEAYWNRSNPELFYGTSAAAPHIAGMAALVMDYHNNTLTPAQTADYLKDNMNAGQIANLPSMGPPPTPTTRNSNPFQQIIIDTADTAVHLGRVDSVYVLAMRWNVDDVYWHATSSNTAVASIVDPNRLSDMRDSHGIWFDSVKINPHNPGTTTITVNVTDNRVHWTKSFDITVTGNTHPSIVSIGEQNIDIDGGAHTITFSANDVDGDRPRWQYVFENHTYFTISAPGECDTDRYQPVCDLPGDTLSVVPVIEGENILLYGAHDGRGGTDIDAVDVNVAPNTDTVHGNVTDVTTTSGESVTVRFQATDADGDVIIHLTPLLSDIGIAEASIPFHLSNQEALDTRTVTPAPGYAVESVTYENDAVTSMTVLKEAPSGNMLRYVVNGTGGLPAMPESVIITNPYERSPTPTTANLTITITGLSVGNTTIYSTVRDVWGGSDTKNFTVTVLPAAPVITLAGQTNMTVPFNTTYVEPGYTATDREDDDITADVTVTGTVDTTKIGTYTLHYDVTDSSGTPAIRQVRTVHVADVTPPVITLVGPANMTVSINSTYADPGYTATDDYDGDLTGNVVVTGTVDASVLGAYRLHYDVTDSSGNAAVTQNRTVTVVADGAPPVITLKGQRAMTVEGGTIYVEPGYAAIDDIDGNVTGMVVVTGMVDTTVLDTYTIYYDVSDSVGNAAITQSRTVTVVDTTPPVLTLKGGAEITIPASVPYVDPGYEAIDAMDGNVTDRVNVVGTVNTDAQGLYKILYIVADGSGNLADTLERNVIVADMTPPVITLKGGSEVWVAKGMTYTEPGYTATDNIDGNITGRVVVTGTVDANTEGTYVLHYDIADRAGNAAITQNRTVTVVVGDATPVITLKGQQEMTVEVRAGYVEPGYTATDHEDGNITANVTVTGTVDTTTTGTYRLYYDVSDSSGNHAVQQVRTIHVVDVTPPTITLAGPADMTVPVNSAYADPGYTATDDYDGDLTGNVTVTGTVDTATTGTYTIYYDVADSSGNAAVQQVRTVRVGDVTPPTITLAGPADVTIQVNSAYADPGYTATDDYDGDLTGKVTVTGTVDTATTGTYRLYYDVSDSSGNQAVQQVRTVHVVAATPPAIALSGPHTVTVPFGSAYSEPGYTATDREDGDLTASVVVTGTVDATKTGTYTLYYDVSDSFGNAAVQQTRIVRVVDVTSPTITLAGQTNMTIPVNSTYADPGYAAADDYDGDLTGSVTVTGTVDTTTIGTYTIYYDVSDSSGNAAMQQVRTVHVEAIPDPQAGLPEVVKRYDTDRNGSISQQEWARAIQDYTSGLLTAEEIYAISAARSYG